MRIQFPGKANEIYNFIKKTFDQYKQHEALAKFQVKDVMFDDQNHQASAKGMGFEVKIKCQDNAIDIDLNLGMLLKPLKGTIENKIQEMIEKSNQKIT